MRERGGALIALCGLIGLALALLGCNGFFVSPNSVGSITVSPTSALLLQGGNDNQQLTVNATLVNGNSDPNNPVTSSSTCTSSNTAVVKPDPNTVCQIDAVGAGSATVTVSLSGATPVGVPFVVVATPISSITITSSASQISVTGSSGLPSTAQLVAAAESQNIANFVTWTANGGGLTVSSSGVLTASTTLVQTSGTVTASLSASAVTNNNPVTSNPLTIIVNP